MSDLFNNSAIREVNVMTPELRKEDCELTEIKMMEDKSVVFGFVDSKGNGLNQRFFMPTRKENGSDDDFKKSIQLTISCVAHIARAYLSEAEFLAIKLEDGGNLNKVAQNWVDYINMTGKALSGKYKGVKCALKVVYRKSKDNKYYSSLPQVPPFISTANHPKEFTLDPKYDIMQKGASMPDREMPNQEATTAPAGGTAPGTW